MNKNDSSLLDRQKTLKLGTLNSLGNSLDSIRTSNPQVVVQSFLLCSIQFLQI